MSEQQQQPTEPVVTTGSGDADFDAALAQVTPTEIPAIETPAVETPAVEPPAPASDFTFSTLENGERELRLVTGEIYKGKDDAELLSKLATGKLEANRHITSLNAKIKEAPVAPVTPHAEPTIDPTALAIADLLAPAFKVKNGAELIAAFAEQQRTTQAQQEYMEAQRSNMEAATFFRNVPEFSKSQADADKIDGFLKDNGLPFTALNAELAYDHLKKKGEMTAAATPRTTPAPKNNMPPPPSGTAPANTGKGDPTETDMWNMTPDQLEVIMSQASA